MQHSTPVSAFFGGLLISLGAVVLMLFPSRIAGIAGIVGGLLGFDCRENRLAADIVLGLIAGPLSVGLPSADGVQHSQCGSRCIARALFARTIDETNEAVLSRRFVVVSRRERWRNEVKTWCCPMAAGWDIPPKVLK